METSMMATTNQQEQSRRVLIVVSVQAEKDAVLRGLHGPMAAGARVCASQFDVLVGGVGVASAAASTATALATNKYDLVVSAGIGGGFVGRAEVGSLVVASEIVAADLGAQTPDGFLSLDELGFGSTRIPVDANLVTRLTDGLNTIGLPFSVGPVLTVSTVTGTAATASELSARVEGVACEAMEGYGVATAARHSGLPVLEIRAISNPVGPRDRSAWRIGEALHTLEKTSNVLWEVL